jgi:hypothetical protein
VGGVSHQPPRRVGLQHAPGEVAESPRQNRPRTGARSPSRAQHLVTAIGFLAAHSHGTVDLTVGRVAISTVHPRRDQPRATIVADPLGACGAKLLPGSRQPPVRPLRFPRDAQSRRRGPRQRRRGPPSTRGRVGCGGRVTSAPTVQPCCRSRLHRVLAVAPSIGTDAAIGEGRDVPPPLRDRAGTS